jgi:hypothetical protein
MAEDGVVVCDVSAYQEYDIGRLHVGIGSGRSIGTERELIASDGRRHAESRIAIVIACSKPELHKLAERIALFREKLAGTDNAEGIVPMPSLDITKAIDHCVESFIPGDGRKHPILA